MVDYSTPWQMGQQGLMTGIQLGTLMREQRNARELGGLMSSGNIEGARNLAYTQGDLQTGQALDGRVQQQADQQRGRNIVGALKTNDYAGALDFANSPEELQAIQQFRDSASEQDRLAAAQRSEQLAMVVGSIQSLPPDQQFAAAQAAAAQFGLDPQSITPDMVTPQALERMRMQSLGLKDYLTYQQKERDALRPIIGNGFISLPPGSQVPNGGGQPQTLGSSLPPGWTPQPRPNSGSSAPASGGSERSQTPRVSFQSSNEARTAVQQLFPGVRITSGRRSPQENARVGGARTSFHLQDRALDLVPPPGMTMAQLADQARRNGFRALNEGDHIHISW